MQFLELLLLSIVMFNSCEIMNLFTEGKKSADQSKYKHFNMCLFPHFYQSTSLMIFNLIIGKKSIEFSQVYLSMNSNQAKHLPDSFVDIRLQSRSIFILPDQNSSILESKTFCFYFPQFGEIFYVQLTHKQQKQKNLQTFVREIMIEKDLCAKWKVSLNVSLGFKTFGENEQIIVPTSKLFYKQCVRVKIILQGILQRRIFENKTTLQIRLSSEKTYIVEVDAHLKMRMGELLILYKLDHYKFSSLMIDGNIVKQHQTLQKLNLQAIKHDAHVLFPFQTFYYDMHAIYKHMISKGINLQELIRQYVNNPQQNQALQLIYKNTPTSNLDKITQFTILYITSKYFQLAQHKKYLCQYFNGKVKQLQNNKQSQMTSLMINSLQRLNQLEDTKVIYIYQQILDEFQYQSQFIQGQIFRIQTLSPATNSIQKLKLQPTKRYLFYEIEHLSAKYIGKYTCQRMGFTHIVLPYNNYLVKSIKNQDQNVYVQLIELPTPKHLDHNLILWITDNFNEAKAFDSKKIIEQSVKYQLMLFKNVQTYQIWLKKYISLTASREFCIIYNKDEPLQGVKTIQIAKQYLGQNADILMYLNENYQQFEPFLDFNKIFLTNNINSVFSFILKCFREPQQIQCQSCNCSIS